MTAKNAAGYGCGYGLATGVATGQVIDCTKKQLGNGSTRTHARETRATTTKQTRITHTRVFTRAIRCHKCNQRLTSMSPVATPVATRSHTKGNKK